MNKFLELRLKQEQAVRDIQNNCLHKEGNILGQSPGNLTSIWWHKLDTFWIGVCFHCGRRFYPGEPDYGYWYNKKPMGFPSTSGTATTITDEQWCSDEVQKELALQWAGLDKVPFDPNRFIYEWDSDCKKFHIKDIV